MTRLRATPHLIFITVCTSAIAALHYVGAFGEMELPIQDAFMRVGKKPPADESLVFLAIDTASVSLDPTDLEEFLHLEEADADSARALRLMAKEWPWSREVHGLVLRRLVEAGARQVAFDLNFPKPSLNDAPLANALETYRDHVALVGNYTADAPTDGLNATFNPPSTTLIPQSAIRDPRVGYDNFWPDFDGCVRRAHYRRVITHGVHQDPEELSLTARVAQRTGKADLVPPGTAPQRLRFAGAAGTFAPRSIFEIFAPRYWKGNYASGEFFRGKTVLIGGQGNWQHDEHPTPMGVMPGAEIHLHALNALLHSSFLHELPLFVEALLVLVAGLLPALIRRLVKGAIARFAALLLATAAWAFAAFASSSWGDFVLPCFAPLLALGFSGTSGLGLDFVLARREKTHLRRMWERYMSRDVVEEILDHPEEHQRALGGELRPVTVLFSDIRNFTGFAGAVDPKTLVTQLNEYFSEMVACVFRFRGNLDKFIGDALMAVWGNTGRNSPGTNARNAVLCALAMREALERLNERWRREGRPELRMGIGINAGDAVVGNIGSPHRMEFAVIGGPVNEASRIQDATKRLGTDLLLGEGVIRQLGAEFPTEGEATVVVSGDLTVQCACLAEPALADFTPADPPKASSAATARA